MATVKQAFSSLSTSPWDWALRRATTSLTTLLMVLMADGESKQQLEWLPDGA